MSQLRNQLQASRQAHLGQHYPGDLVAEMLNQSREWTAPLKIALVAAGAMAALIAISVFLNHPASVQTPVAQTDVATTLQSESLVLMDAPTFPADISLAPGEIEPVAPVYQSIMIENVPFFPSIDLLETEQPTTQPESA